MVNRQIGLLEWMYDNQDHLPLGRAEIHQIISVTTEYPGSKSALSQLVTKLEEKGLVERPDYGKYEISKRGINKVETLRDVDSEKIVRPENYDEVLEELKAFIFEEKDEELHQSLVQDEPFKVSLKELDCFNSDLITGFMQDSFSDFLDALDEAIEFCAEYDEEVDYQIVPDLEFLETSINDAITSKTVGRPVIVKGLIRKSEQISPKILSATFRCVECGDVKEKKQDSSQLKSPYKCDCGSKRYEPVEKEFTDVIDFQLSQRDNQESKVDCEYEGANPQDTNELMSGQRVKVLAVPEQVPRSKQSKKFDTKLQVQSFERLDKKTDIAEFSEDKKEEVVRKIEESEDPFEDFAESIAPDVGDMERPKKLIATSLIGAPEEEKGATTDYGRIHVGIMTNPGMGKSQLQEWVRETFNNFHLATGGSGTGTALTATAEQNKGGQWTLVAGKIVFADGGHLQLDEFDKFPKGELTKLNEAIESGYFPIDKASVSAKLPGRASVIATGNFTRKLDEYTDPLEVLPEKGQGLYDRFALMCAVTDQGDEAVDKILNLIGTDVTFSPDELRIYRHLARGFNPELTEDAKYHLRDHFQASKSNSDSSTKGISNRMVVNLRKLTKVFARARLSDEAIVEDAKKATKIMRESRESLGLDLGEDPGAEFRKSRKLQAFEEAFEQFDSQPVDVTDLKEVYTSQGFDASEFEEVFSKVKKEGEFFTPEAGEVKKVC